MNVHHLVATVGGIGHSRYAPGTCGSAAAALAYWFVPALPWQCLLGATALLFFLGWWCSERVVASLQDPDPSWIVIDEWVGMWISLIGLTHKPLLFFIAFLVFRVLDIAKPFPIWKAELLPGGLGIMADDCVAGLITLVFMHLVVSPYF